MAKFVELTSDKGRRILFNSDLIKYIDVNSEGVVFVNFSEEEYYAVKEPLTVVKARLE
jgi:hypothetical protein